MLNHNMVPGDHVDDLALLESVAVRNRVQDAPVKIIFDSKEVIWKPNETRHLPKKYAEFFVHKSTYQYDPITMAARQKLVIVDSGADESPLTQKGTEVLELLDRTNMPATMFDEDGNPMTPEIKQVRVQQPPVRGRVPIGEKTTEGFGAAGPMDPAVAAQLDVAHTQLAEVAAADTQDFRS